MLLDNQVVVISGGAVGIGRGIAIACAKEGADVATLDIDVPENAETARLVRETGRKALAIDCDVTNPANVRRAFNDIYQLLGGVDVLVNNAAVYVDTSLTRGTFETQSREYVRSVSVCAFGGYFCALAAVPSMKARGSGHIINVITEHIKPDHLMTGPGATGYDSAKWVQWRQTESWAVELKPFGIRVNALCPGATDTPMLRAVSAAAAEAGMRPEDLGQAVLNIIGQGPNGPVGQSWLVGPSRSGREKGLADIAALVGVG
jgi:NAD(P)-dependent dehydrogenase (short-subunit alcohol dehydrogenase family)